MGTKYINTFFCAYVDTASTLYSAVLNNLFLVAGVCCCVLWRYLWNRVECVSM